MNFFLYYVLPFIFVLGILVFFHELGHFLVAKFFGVKVLRFSLGFGPKLAGKKVGDTEYLVSAVPLGGYVKMLGESEDEDTEALSPEEEMRSFSNQGVVKRIAIVAAGPLFNFLLALLIFCFFYMAFGVQVLRPEVGKVRAGSPAEQAGLRKGDVILRVGETKISKWSDIKKIVQGSAGESLDIIVKRRNKFLTLTVVPEESIIKNIFGEEIKAALIGVIASGEVDQVDLGILEAINEGAGKTWEIVELTCLTIVKLFQRAIPIKTLGGPILIGQMTGKIAQQNLTYLLPFVAVISVNLGILNLFPVPVLDGGLLIFFFVELIIGKPISINKRDLAQKVGLFLLIALMALVIYNDLTRLIE